jgi:hypothetical protein
MLKAPPHEKIRSMTSQQRAILYRNANTYYDQGGKAIVDLIDAEGLALSDGDLLSTDPDYLRMEEIIWSDAGRKAAIAAVEAGRPALAGVDPLLAEDFGDRYHPHNAGTISLAT